MKKTKPVEGLVFDEARMVYTVQNGVGDEIEICKAENGGLWIEIDEPWAGSTETGFGATTRVNLPPQIVEFLRDWL